MYLGCVVEIARRDELYERSAHSYTQALLSAVPVPDPQVRCSRTVLVGDVPNPAAVPAGCPFHPRCPEREQICTRVAPRLVDLGAGHCTACLLRYPAEMRDQLAADAANSSD